jgi:hypothetical protein
MHLNDFALQQVGCGTQGCAPSGEAVAILELDEGLTGNAFLSLSLHTFSLCPPSAIEECTWARISRSPLRKRGHHPEPGGDERLYPLPSSSSLTSCFSTEQGQRTENGGPSARSLLYWLGLLPSPPYRGVLDGVGLVEVSARLTFRFPLL